MKFATKFGGFSGADFGKATAFFWRVMGFQGTPMPSTACCWWVKVV